MLDIPFLTALDSRAAVKGSRDPLGMQPIWTRFGRHVVGNLTTVSNSLRDFTTLLLGHFFAERVAEDSGPGTELETFLKWEQLAAYARAGVNKDLRFRGTERVQRNLAEDDRVTLSADRAHQILGNQKIYGLWGLYTVPARASGLVDGDPARVTPAAIELIEEVYLPILVKGAGRDATRLREVLRTPLSRIDTAGKDRSLVEAVANVLKPTFKGRERDFFRSHILHGGPCDETDGRQRQLAGLAVETTREEDFAWSPTRLSMLMHVSRARGDDWQALAYYLGRIRASETVLAPVSALFTHLLGLDGKPIGDISERLREQWGRGLPTINASEFEVLRSEIAAGDPALGDRWVAIARTLAAGEYEPMIGLLLEQNQKVMAERGGTPWAEVRNGKLHVRFRDEQGALPPRDDLPALWRYSYFIDSLRSVALALEAN